MDHEPPVQIHTELSTTGIRWKAGDEVPIWRPDRKQIDLFTTPDEIQFDVDAFNRKVITEPFNRVVCDYLASEIDPASRHRTLMRIPLNSAADSGVTDAHADLVVDLVTIDIDVPAICNLVFLRRVNSRILADHMLGRATRPCDDIGKDSFRMFGGELEQVLDAFNDALWESPAA